MIRSKIKTIFFAVLLVPVVLVLLFILSMLVDRLSNDIWIRSTVSKLESIELPEGAELLASDHAFGVLGGASNYCALEVSILVESDLDFSTFESEMEGTSEDMILLVVQYLDGDVSHSSDGKYSYGVDLTAFASKYEFLMKESMNYFTLTGSLWRPPNNDGRCH
jgi:hypothetical protein